MKKRSRKMGGLKGGYFRKFLSCRTTHNEKLSDLYDADNAIATMSCNLFGQFGKTDAAVQKYRKLSRNMLPVLSWSRMQSSTVVGALKIEELWREFGATEHDLQSFTIDMTYYTVSSFEYLFLSNIRVKCIFSRSPR